MILLNVTNYFVAVIRVVEHSYRFGRWNDKIKELYESKWRCWHFDALTIIKIFPTISPYWAGLIVRSLCQWFDLLSWYRLLGRSMFMNINQSEPATKPCTAPIEAGELSMQTWNVLATTRLFKHIVKLSQTYIATSLVNRIKWLTKLNA